MHVFIVYCHINLTNGKRYVGWTSKSISQRWREHVGSKSTFGRAIRKHGQRVWVHITLDQCASKDDAKLKEIQWIERFGSFRRGYNMTTGGDGAPNYAYTEAVKILMRSHGKPLSQATRQRLSEMNRGSRHPMWGRHHTNAARDRISKNNPRRRPVEQLSIDGQVIAVFSSITEAARATAHPDYTKIGLCCRGKRKSTRGFRWRFHSWEEIFPNPHATHSTE